MISVRAATLDDAADIVRHRRAMFFDMGYRDARALDSMASAFDPWLRRKMDAGEYLAWVGIGPDGSIVAGVGLWLMDWPPHLIGGAARRGNILNVYTEPKFRRQGIARRLMEVSLDWCRANGIPTVILHASDDGRKLYERLGFQPTNEMRRLFDTSG